MKRTISAREWAAIDAAWKRPAAEPRHRVRIDAEAAAVWLTLAAGAAIFWWMAFGAIGRGAVWIWKALQ
jgi:hypothetical protein